ncbi:hypothetical protein JW848_03795 [Candidatus Bipolaricaulota bacterium]|nr:hypothetical protein [Candidatus Bipolaricaulota bacterium]
MMSRFLRVASAVALLFGFVAGCGGGDGFDRVAISGTVTCEGMENPSGSFLASAAEASTKAPNVSAPVTDGKFSVPADQGPVPGSYMFEVSLLVPGAQPAPGESPEGEKESGPEVMYRKKVDIPAGGSDSLSIDLTAADKVNLEE